MEHPECEAAGRDCGTASGYRHGGRCHRCRMAKAAYIAEIERLQAAGVAWEPDWCPIWDRVAAGW